MKTCTEEDCDATEIKARGLCKKHYMRFRRGTLGVPARHHRKPGPTKWPIAVRKIDGEWHRRPSDCDPETPWEPVVWAEDPIPVRGEW